jgi:hypothetical protein
MPNCIYCGSADTTEEHPLPRCLGQFKGYVTLPESVCSRCNGICGQLDEQLCRCGSEAFFRKYLGVSGRASHDDVNPFYRGSSRGGRLEMLGTSHETGEERELEIVAPNEVRELRCVKLVAPDDSVHTIAITDGMAQADFRAKVKALGITVFKHANISAAPEEIPWIESLFEGFKWERGPEWVQPQGPVVYGPSTIKFTVTDRYFRAIAKIGFHYFLTKFPRFHGDEPWFAGIRHFIIGGSIEEIGQFVTWGHEQFVAPLREGSRLRVWGHFLAAESDYHSFRAKVQLFVGPQSRSLVYLVQLGQNPSRIVASESYADFFVYYAPEDRSEFDGEVSGLPMLTRMPMS